MAQADSSSDQVSKQGEDVAASARLPRGGVPDDTDALIDALNQAEAGFDAEVDAAYRQPDSSADVIEILDAEPLLAEDEALSGAPDPVDLTTRRANNETPRDRRTVYERELDRETDKTRRALLQHELGLLQEQQGADHSEVLRAYAETLALDPTLRPNLWAMRRSYLRRNLWPSLLKLLDTEARFASTKRERAEVWTEKGHILEDLLGEVQEAIVCYRTAHELDPSALAPLAALEKLLTQKGGLSEQGGSSIRPSDELLSVYRGLTSVTNEPGRKVALLTEQARIEEEYSRITEPSGTSGGDLERVIAYLHEAYDAGIDQLRVVDEIIRITARYDRIPDCLAALEVKAEILELSSQQMTTQRRELLMDQVVAIRRLQAQLSRDRLSNTELAWQYLDKAQQKSPANPLLMPDLIALAEAQGRHSELAELLQTREDQLRAVRGDDAPQLLGLWLKRALALRSAGQDSAADELEQLIAAKAPSHLLLLLGRQRRALAKKDWAELAELLRQEAQLATDGLPETSPAGTTEAAPRKPDLMWACDSWLAAAHVALEGGDDKRAEEALAAAAKLTALADPTAASTQLQQWLIELAREDMLLRSGRQADLASHYEQRLAKNPADREALRMQSALLDLHGDTLGNPSRALSELQKLQATAKDDLRLYRREAELARRAGDAPREVAALHSLAQAEQRLGVSSTAPWDLLRRAELSTAAGQGHDVAIALYEQVLAKRPGELQALEPIEQLLRDQGKRAELQTQLSKQIELAKAALKQQSDDAQDSELSQRLLQMQAKLLELLESSPEAESQAAQAIAIYQAILAQRPQYWPALRALARHYQKPTDAGKLQAVLEQLAEALPSGAARADVWLRIAELRESSPSPRPALVDEAFSAALSTMPVPSLAAAHAALGRMRQQTQKRSASTAAEVLDALADSLIPGEPLAETVTALLTEERVLLSTYNTGSSSTLERAETQLTKAAKDLQAGLATSKEAYPEASVLMNLARLRVAQQREDNKQQGTILAVLAQQVEALATPSSPAIAGELWLRAGLLGALAEDESGQQADAARRLIMAYRLLGDIPEVVVPLADLLADLSLMEQLGKSPELVAVLKARQALCPPGDTDDRLQWMLLEAEAWLLRAGDADAEAALRVTALHNAAQLLLRVLQIDPHHVLALLLLRQATAPSEIDPLADRDVELSPDAVARVRAYSIYTLRLASELRDSEARAELYSEAAQLLQRIGDTDGASAALRAVLEQRPWDATTFGQLRSLLMRKADEGDAGSLLELLNFRLGLTPESLDSDEAKRSEQVLRVSLLSQRAVLQKAAGQLRDAETDLLALLELDPGHALSHRLLAELRTHQGDTDAAVYHYEQFLQLDKGPTERQFVHEAVARLLTTVAPGRAAIHVRSAIDVNKKYRELRGDEVSTTEEMATLMALYRWLVELLQAQGQPEDVVQALRELEALCPAGPQFATEREQILLDLATALEQQVSDRPGAIVVVEKALTDSPLSLRALTQLVALSKATGETARPQSALQRATAEARKQVLQMALGETELAPATFSALGQLFSWQGHSVMASLAGQAQQVARGALKQPTEPVTAPPLKIPGRSVGPPLMTPAFAPEARGVMVDLWTEVWETANRVLLPELSTLGVHPRERLNAKEVPAAWASVDQLAQRFGLGSSNMTQPYLLLAVKDNKDQCQVIGNHLLCGSNLSAPLSTISGPLFYRLVRKLTLLPNHLGPLDKDGPELLWFIAACCQLAQAPGPTIPSDQKIKYEERLRSVDRAITRKERSALRALAPRLGQLEGTDGTEFVTAWQQAIQLGSARLALAICGNLEAALSDLGIGPAAEGVFAARLWRTLTTFSVSSEIQSLRRELGLAE